jgi:hypothetical protein
VWHTFWYGANLEGADRPGPARAKPYSEPGSWWGATWSWPLIGVTAAGVWLLAAPSVFGTTGAAADSDHLVAAIVVTVAVVALAEPAHALRYANLAAGVAPGGALGARGIRHGGTGQRHRRRLVVIALSLPRGPVHDRYGSWDRLIR